MRVNGAVEDKRSPAAVRKKSRTYLGEIVCMKQPFRRLIELSLTRSEITQTIRSMRHNCPSLRFSAVKQFIPYYEFLCVYSGQDDRRCIITYYMLFVCTGLSTHLFSPRHVRTVIHSRRAALWVTDFQSVISFHYIPWLQRTSLRWLRETHSS